MPSEHRERGHPNKRQAVRLQRNLPISCSQSTFQHLFGLSCRFAPRDDEAGMSLFIKKSFRYSPKRLLRAPATGYRADESGVLSGVGAHGNFLSSSSLSVTSVTATGLHFQFDRVQPLPGLWHAAGRSVRCVQHLRLLRFQKKVKSGLAAGHATWCPCRGRFRRARPCREWRPVRR